ncbi:MAG: hypothetical protein MZV70_01805 [Desulfobacterales bacterium]|nr:hypothetical protein [Desulfobacterales bacterium]
MQAAHYARKYGELPLPDLHDLLRRDRAGRGQDRSCCATALKPSLGVLATCGGVRRRTASIRCSEPARGQIADG